MDCVSAILTLHGAHSEKYNLRVAAIVPLNWTDKPFRGGCAKVVSPRSHQRAKGACRGLPSLGRRLPSTYSSHGTDASLAGVASEREQPQPLCATDQARSE
jgi:hypothetical protein